MKSFLSLKDYECRNLHDKLARETLSATESNEKYDLDSTKAILNTNQTINIKNQPRIHLLFTNVSLIGCERPNEFAATKTTSSAPFIDLLVLVTDFLSQRE